MVPDCRDVAGTSQEKDESNDMVKLFYGKVKTYGYNAGRPVDS